MERKVLIRHHRRRRNKNIDEVEALIHTFVTTAENIAPELKGYHHDFDTGTFRDAQGKPVSTDTLSAIRRINGSGVDGLPRLGEATARRAILLKTLMGSESSEASGRRGSILEQVLRWGDHGTPRSLDTIFSRGTEGDDLYENRAEGAGDTRLTKSTGGSETKLENDSASTMPISQPTQDPRKLSQKDMDRVRTALKMKSEKREAERRKAQGERRKAKGKA